MDNKKYSDLNGSAVEQSYCRDFLRNVCTRGKRCKFKHLTASECETLGINIQGLGQALCKDFNHGFCNRNSCKFVHAKPHVTVQPVADDAGPEFHHESPICKDFMKGICRRGQSCKFRHISTGCEAQTFLQAPAANCRPVSAAAAPTSQYVPLQSVVPVAQAPQVFIQLDSPHHPNGSGPMLTATSTGVPALIQQSRAATAILQPAAQTAAYSSQSHQIARIVPQQGPVFVENTHQLFTSSPATFFKASASQPANVASNPIPVVLTPSSSVVTSESSASPSSTAVIAAAAAANYFAQHLQNTPSTTGGTEHSIFEQASSSSVCAKEASSGPKKSLRSGSASTTTTAALVAGQPCVGPATSTSPPPTASPPEAGSNDQLSTEREERSPVGSPRVYEGGSGAMEEEEAASDGKREQKEVSQLRSSVAMTAAAVAAVAAAAAVEHHHKQQQQKQQQQQQQQPLTAVVPTSCGEQHQDRIAAIQRLAVAQANRKQKQAQLEQQIDQAEHDFYLSSSSAESPYELYASHQLPDQRTVSSVGESGVDEEEDDDVADDEVGVDVDHMDDEDDDYSKPPAPRRRRFNTAEAGEPNGHEVGPLPMEPSGDKPFGKTLQNQQRLMKYVRHLKRGHTALKSEVIKLKFRLGESLRQNADLRTTNQLLMEQNVRLRQSSKEVVAAARFAESAAAQVSMGQQIYLSSAAVTAAGSTAPSLLSTIYPRSSTTTSHAITTSCAAPITFVGADAAGRATSSLIPAVIETGQTQMTAAVLPIAAAELPTSSAPTLSYNAFVQY